MHARPYRSLASLIAMVAVVFVASAGLAQTGGNWSYSGEGRAEGEKQSGEPLQQFNSVWLDQNKLGNAPAEPVASS